MSMKSDSIGVLIDRYRDQLDSVMLDIESALSDSGFEFTSNSKKTEFVVLSTDREMIHSLILTTVSLPELVTDTVINIKESNNKIYIRQRVK